MSEAHIREVLGSLPGVVSQLSPGPLRDQLARSFCDDYLNNCLPADFVDGILLHLLRVSRLRYPLYFHGARLLSRGNPAATVQGWIELSGWQDLATLGVALAQTPVEPLDGLSFGGLGTETELLVARTVLATTLSPALGSEIQVILGRRLTPQQVAGLSQLRSFWSFVTTVYASAEEPRIGTDPLLMPYLDELRPLLEGRLSRPTAHAVPDTSLNPADPGAVTAKLAVTVLENFPVGVLRLDRAGRIVWENPAMRRILGVPHDRATPAHGVRITELPNMRATGHIEEVAALVDRGIPMARIRTGFKTLLGREITVTVEGQPLPGGDGHDGAVLVVTDVGREVELEEKLARALRTELFGTLVGGIAHDLNNLLVGVRANAELLSRRTPPGAPNHRLVQRLDDAASRLAAVVDGLLALAHRGSAASQGPVVDCRAALLAVPDVASEIIPRNVRIDVDAGDKPLPARVEQVQLEQVLLNLVLNARDAILARGGDGRVTLTGQIHDGDVLLQVSDDGVGMNRETRARIFDPLFTTKPRGEGTGLGLPVSRAIARVYGGDVRCESVPGRGTVFSLTLPVPEDVPEGLALPPKTAAITVLLVEDNIVVQTLCEEILSTDGAVVSSAQNGAEAIAAAREQQFSMAVIDIGLPDIDGRRVAEQIGSMPVLLMSGTPPHDIERWLSGRKSPTRFIKKPFQLPALLEAVAELLR